MEYDGILAERFIQEYPSKAAEVLEGLSDEEIAAFFQDSPIEIVVPVLNLMNDYRLAKSFSLLPEELASHLLENALVAKIESLLRQFDEPFRNTLLDKLSLGLAAALRTKLKQEAHSVGALMNLLP